MDACGCTDRVSWMCQPYRNPQPEDIIFSWLVVINIDW